MRVVVQRLGALIMLVRSLVRNLTGEKKNWGGGGLTSWAYGLDFLTD